MKIITLSQDKMSFLVKNAIAHDSALHDFGGNSKLAYGRLVQVLHNPQGGGAKTQHGGMVSDDEEEYSYKPSEDDSQGAEGPQDPEGAGGVNVSMGDSGDRADSSYPGGPPQVPVRQPAQASVDDGDMSDTDTAPSQVEPALLESEAEVPYQIINTLSDPNIKRLLFYNENEAGIMDPRVFNPPPQPAVPPLYYYLHFVEGTYCAYDFTIVADDTYKANIHGIDRSIRITTAGIFIDNGNGETPIYSLTLPPPITDAITMLNTSPPYTFEVISAYINTKTLLKSRGAEVLIENIFFRPIVNISADAQAILIDPAQPMKVRLDAASQIILEQDLVTNPLTITVDNILKLSDTVTTIQRGLLPTIRVGTHPLDAGDFIANAILVRFNLQIQGMNDPSLIKAYDTQINTLDKYIQFISGSDPTNLDFQKIYIRLAETRDVLKNARDIIEENFKNRDYSPFQKKIENNINAFISPSPTEDNTERLKGFIRVILEDKNIDIPSTMRKIGLIPTVETLNNIGNFDVNTIPETLLLSYYRCVMNCMRYNDLDVADDERYRVPRYDKKISRAASVGQASTVERERERGRGQASTVERERSRSPNLRYKGGRGKFNSKFAYIASVSSRNPRLKQKKFLTYITDFTSSPTSNMPYSARKVITDDYNPVSPPAPAPPDPPPVFNINNLYGFYVPEADFTAALPTNLEQLFKDYNDFPIDNFNITLANDLSKDMFNDPETPAASATSSLSAASSLSAQPAGPISPSSQYNKYDVLYLFSLIISIVNSGGMGDLTTTQIRVPATPPAPTTLRDVLTQYTPGALPPALETLRDTINGGTPTPLEVYTLLINYVNAYLNDPTNHTTDLIDVLAAWLTKNPFPDIVKPGKEIIDSYGIILNFQEGFFFMLETIDFVSKFIKELNNTTTPPGATAPVSILNQYIRLDPTTGRNDIDIDIAIDPTKAFIFFQLVGRCCKEYADLADKAFFIKTNNVVETLTALEKTASGYSLGCILQSVNTAMSAIPSSPILTIEQKMIDKILLKKAGIRTALNAFSFGDSDTELYNGFMKYIESPQAGGYQGRFHAVNKGPKGLPSNIFDDLIVQWGSPPLITDMVQAIAEGKRFLINNSINVKNEIGDLKYFCPEASIADPMPQCNNVNSARKDGIEYGTMDVLIRTPAGTPGPIITYRVRVVPVISGTNLTAVNISAYVQINGVTIINRGGGPSWQVGSTAGIVSPLNGAGINPLDAKTCLRSIFRVTNSGFIGHLKRSGYENLIDYLGLVAAPPSGDTGGLAQLRDAYINLVPTDPIFSTDSTVPTVEDDRRAETDPITMRRNILEASFVKSLGDFLQEINGVTDNGGYEEAVPITYSNTGVTIVPSNLYRLQLSNDRPSGVRAVLMLLYGTGNIRVRAVAGYITNNKYALAGRGVGPPGQGGGRRNRKSRKHIKKHRKTKKRNHKTKMKKTKHRSKKQKHTRR